MFRSIGWCARMFWWVFFWPVGLILSIRRGTRKRHQETMRALQRPTMVTAAPMPQQPHRVSRPIRQPREDVTERVRSWLGRDQLFDD